MVDKMVSEHGKNFNTEAQRHEDTENYNLAAETQRKEGEINLIRHEGTGKLQ